MSGRWLGLIRMNCWIYFATAEKASLAATLASVT